jgi:hypothetical protein
MEALVPGREGLRCMRSDGAALSIVLLSRRRRGGSGGGVVSRDGCLDESGLGRVSLIMSSVSAELVV